MPFLSSHYLTAEIALPASERWRRSTFLCPPSCPRLLHVLHEIYHFEEPCDLGRRLATRGLAVFALSCGRRELIRRMPVSRGARVTTDCRQLRAGGSSR